MTDETSGIDAIYQQAGDDLPHFLDHQPPEIREALADIDPLVLKALLTVATLEELAVGSITLPEMLKPFLTDEQAKHVEWDANPTPERNLPEGVADFFKHKK